MTRNEHMPEPGLYRHYKGRDYRVIGLARHSESGDWLVVYQPQYGDGGWWVRPREMFLESVYVDDQPMPRFRRIGD